ncbi:hypothetical protein [Companilactobacillus zhongbaensis]|uniref:hypothetical protein n=1 Tax=Companilactobacillus zhongbaensis TaxID=2486009 RepID=UPI0017811120|nr:hypothetical protein [Companilactobacillus zhongbaensis]
MKTTKLVIGILMILLSIFIVIQSMAAGLSNAIESNNSTSGSGGIIMAFAYLVSGIVYLATKSKIHLGGDIANAIILVLFGLVALTTADRSFGDLSVWIWLGMVIGLGFLIWHILQNKKLEKSTNHSDNLNNDSNLNNQQQYDPYGQQSPHHSMTRSELHRNRKK